MRRNAPEYEFQPAVPHAEPAYRTVIVRRSGHPVLLILMAFPIACFSGALVSDIAYAITANFMWADFSAWLLAAGMLIGVLAAIAGVVILLAARRVRPHRPGLLIIGALLVLMLGFLNNFVHSRDAWTSVMPEGLILSVLTVLALLATMWLGTDMSIRETAVTDTLLREPRP